MANHPIVIKRVKKAAHGSHGGAWKVAYADFVTAMMAFFLLLWLLNAVSQEQLEGISDYFSPISTKSATSGGAGLMAGERVASKGVFNSDSAATGPVVELSLDRDDETDDETDDEPAARDGADGATASDRDLAARQGRIEEQQFREAEQQLREALENTPQLKQLVDSLLVDNTPEGLRIQIVDQDRLPMFPRGSAEMYLHTRKILELVAAVIDQMPQDIAISGHTDATRFATDAGYGNWELSADRANAARRALIRRGVPEERIARVVGKAATDPLFADDPEAPANRRLSVVLLRGSGEAPRTVGGERQAQLRGVSTDREK
ncbi:MAG: flagellar motor protein MotB [Rhodospirillales bacterium]